MDTATLFRAYRRAVIEVQAAYHLCKYWDGRARQDSAQSQSADRHFSRRSRQKRKLADRITAELERDPWIYIVEGDPATLPDNPLVQIAAWKSGDVEIVARSVYEHGTWWCWDTVVLDAPCYVYAWQPWPTPPPLPSEDDEQ